MTRPSLIAASVVGLLVTFWVGRQYQGTDSLALALVALITVVFLAGIAELWFRASAISSVGGRASKLASPVHLDTLDDSDPEVASLLRANHQRPGSGLAPLHFAPFAVGLVVLLGLLGTFMGLVDTIAGAQNALGATSDVDSLRAALLSPMHGLTRAFGTSVAGVAASALLGLAQVVVRRDEASLVQSLSMVAVTGADADGAKLDQVQLDVLREILDQGQSLHRLLDERLEEKLGSQLAKKLDEKEGERREREQAFFKTMVDTTRTELSDALGRLEGALSGQVGSIESQAKTFVGNLEAQAKDILGGVGKNTSEMRDALQAVANQSAQQSKAAAVQLSASLEKSSERVNAGFAALEEKVQATEAARLEAAQASTATSADLTTRLQTLVESVETGAKEHQQASLSAAQALRDAGANAGDAWRENAEKAQRSAAETFAEFGGRLADVETKLREEREQDRAEMKGTLEHLAGLVATLASEHTSRAESLHEALKAGHEAEKQQAGAVIEKLAADAAEQMKAQEQRLETLESMLASEREKERAHLAERAEAMAVAVENAAQSSATRVASLEESLEEKRVAAEAATAERLDGLATAIDERFGAYVESLATFETNLEKGRATELEALSTTVADQANAFARALEATGESVQMAAGRVGAGGAELEAVAEMFAGSVDEYRVTSEKWLEALAGVAERPAAEAPAAGENAELMGGYLDQTRAAFDESLRLQRQMQQEMFSELRSMREEAS